MIELPSRHSVDETVGRLEELLRARGIKLFALVDHSGEAASAGLKMPLTRLAIFGSPKAGTPVMLAQPSTAIDLPLKVLVREDAGGNVWVSYNDPEYLRERHGFAEELVQNLAAVAALARSAAAE